MQNQKRNDHLKMKWKSLKNIFTVIAVIFSTEALSYFTGLPFTIIDVLLFPLSIIMIALGVKSLLVRTEQTDEKYIIKRSLISLCGHFVAGFLTLLLGLWSLYEGCTNPLALYTGVKGAAHGYTLLSIGLLLSGYSVYIILKLALRTREIRLINR